MMSNQIAQKFHKFRQNMYDYFNPRNTQISKAGRELLGNNQLANKVFDLDDVKNCLIKDNKFDEAEKLSCEHDGVNYSVAVLNPLSIR